MLSAMPSAWQRSLSLRADGLDMLEPWRAIEKWGAIGIRAMDARGKGGVGGARRTGEEGGDLEAIDLRS